jgi:hypothetical protein
MRTTSARVWSSDAAASAAACCRLRAGFAAGQFGVVDDPARVGEPLRHLGSHLGEGVLGLGLGVGEQLLGLGGGVPGLLGGRGTVGLGLGTHVLGLVRRGGEHRAEPPGQPEELPAAGGVGEQLAGFVEGGARAEVPLDEVLALADGGGELVLGPPDVGVHLEPVVAGHRATEHRSGREDAGQVPGDVRTPRVQVGLARRDISPVVGDQLGTHSTCLPTQFRPEIRNGTGRLRAATPVGGRASPGGAGRGTRSGAAGRPSSLCVTSPVGVRPLARAARGAPASRTLVPWPPLRARPCRAT